MARFRLEKCTADAFCTRYRTFGVQSGSPGGRVAIVQPESERRQD